jgi:hypothetical protein
MTRMGGRIVSGSSVRLHDAAALLPFAGLVLLMPPVIGLFPAAITVAGIPLPVLYLFGIWAMLIVAAFLLARRVPPNDEGAQDADHWTVTPAPDSERADPLS